LSNDSFTSKSRVENPFSPSAADNQILQDKDPNFRVLNLTSNTFTDAGTSYYHKSIGGYHGAKLRRYQELIENGIQPDIKKFASTMSTDSTPVLNMLNTKYFIIPNNEKQPVAYPNNNALGNAWFVSNFQLVDNADAEIQAIKNFRPDSIAIIDKVFQENLAGISLVRDSGDVINLTEYAANKISYSYQAKNKSLAVFSEVYYPKGWNAYLDGVLTPHFRANFILRTMVLPAGNHKLEFKFEPEVYHTGELVSLVSSGTLILLVLLGILLEFLKSRKVRS
jgi:hypothetical protein